MLEKIATESRGGKYELSACKKWIYGIIAGDYFCLIFGFNFRIGYYSYTDSPIIPVQQMLSVILILLVVFFGLLFLYILHLYYRIAQVWEDVIWRNKLYVAFNVFFILLVIIFLSLGWFSLYDETSQKFEILYASMNIYVLYLQFMYSHPPSTR